MTKKAGVISAVVLAAALSGYAVYRAGELDIVGATTVPPSHHNNASVGSGRDEAIVAPSTGSGPRSLDDQDSECADDGSSPAECSD